MKINLKLPAIVLGLLLFFTGFTTVKAQDDIVSLQQFYDELSPYGTWIQDPQYGYVWRPDVDQAEFRPYYSNGHWVMTEYGNTWVSNYDWGWAPFHYGRWIYDSYSRWLWIPDTTWGPAWVDWRSGGGYYGWAPMGPLFSININIGNRYVRPDYCWNFIPQRNIYYTSFPRYRSYNNVTIINRTTVINNTYVRGRNTYYTGPRREDIRRATNQDVKVYRIARNSRADAPRIDNNTVNIYSPRPTRGNVTAKPAPRSVGTYADGRNNNKVGVARNNTTVQRPQRGVESTPAQRSSGTAPARGVTGHSSGNNPATSANRTGVRPNRQSTPAGNANPVMRTETPSTQSRPQSQPAAGKAEQKPQVIQQRQNRQMQAPQRQPQVQQRQPQVQQRQPQVQQRQPQVQQQRPARAEQSRSSGNDRGSSSSRTQSSGRSSRGGN